MGIKAPRAMMIGALATGATAAVLFACGSKDDGQASDSSTKSYVSGSQSTSTRSATTTTAATIPMNYVDAPVIVTYPDGSAEHDAAADAPRADAAADAQRAEDALGDAAEDRAADGAADASDAADVRPDVTEVLDAAGADAVTADSKAD
jgi:hypothetical protein